MLITELDDWIVMVATCIALAKEFDILGKSITKPAIISSLHFMSERMISTTDMTIHAAVSLWGADLR